MREQTFSIDFFELAILAEACIPPRPIARAMFWQQLTDKYWHQMSDPQRTHIWSWLQRNPFYEDSLHNEEETQIFHARFDPDNQYTVHTKYKGKEESHRAFKRNDRYYTARNTWIDEKYIVSVEKLIIKKEY
jgi:hypothetical protein